MAYVWANGSRLLDYSLKIIITTYYIFKWIREKKFNRMCFFQI